VLGRWQLRPDGVIDGEQWQASYPSPAEGLVAIGQRPRHLRLRLSPLPPSASALLSSWCRPLADPHDCRGF
jgi:hypothetical protein